MDRGNKRQRRNDGGGRETIQAAAWLDEEGEFLLRQKKQGARIRVKEGRSKPADVMAVNLGIISPSSDEKTDVLAGYDDEERELRVELPSVMIKKSHNVDETVKEVEEYLKLDKKENRSYWKVMLDISKIRKDEMLAADDPEKRVVETVMADIDNILKDKSLSELEELESKITGMLKDDNPSVDRDFWSQLLKELKKRKAESRLKEVEDRIIAARAERMKKLQKALALREQLRIANKAEKGVAFESIKYDPSMDKQSNANDPSIKPTEVTTWTDFSSRLETQRMKVKEEKFIPFPKDKILEPAASSSLKRKMDDEVSKTYEEINKPLGEDEQTLTEEPITDSEGTVKPQYHNRVVMGFEWNRYNQAHYTNENPPPKVVQGYRFNIFYPDLINSPTAPSYKVIKDDNSGKTCLLVFKAPKPYQDIAFRIINTPWDQSSVKRGNFVSKFEDGVLSLHFKFKKLHYRK